MRLPLEIQFDEEYWPPSEGSARSRAPSHEEGGDGFAVIDGQIDLTEAVRQYVEMARPISPRCGSGCPGTGAAPIEAETTDARWAALSSLREQLSDPVDSRVAE